MYLNVDYFNEHALAFTPLFLMRRLLFAAVIAYLDVNIVLQVLLADILSTLLLVFYITIKPMYDKINNAIQIINECVVLLCVWLVLLFTEYVPSPEQRYDFAFVFLYVIALDAGLNLLIFIYILVKKVCKAIRQCYLKAQVKKRKQRQVDDKMAKKNDAKSDIVEL